MRGTSAPRRQQRSKAKGSTLGHHAVAGIKVLTSNQEEADTRIMFHLAFSVQNGCKRVVICSDTDIVMLCMYYADTIAGLKELWVWKSCNEFIPAHEIASSLGLLIVNALPAIHAITGCDTTSRF